MIKINYIEKGTGFPIVFVHGLSDDLKFWEPLIPELSKNHYVIALDLRGHGKSEKPEGPYSIKQFADDIHEFLLKLEIKKAHFIGFSMGGAILQQFTLQYPEIVESLVLISSFSYINPYLEDKLTILRKSLIEGGFGAFFDEILPLILTQQFIKNNQFEIAEVRKEKIKTESREALIWSIDACIEFNLKDEISNISKSTLIISGKNDQLTPPGLSKQIYAAINDSIWEKIDNTSHNVFIHENIPILLDIITQFL